MPTHEIPCEQWPAFLADFGNCHLGWLVTVELHQPGHGTLIEADHQPLQDLLNERAGRHSSISVVLGAPAEPHLTHIVEDPTHLRVREAPPGVGGDLEIESEDGSSVVLHLYAPARRQDTA